MTKFKKSKIKNQKSKIKNGKSKMKNSDIKKIFLAHRVNFSDDGFSKDVFRRLPERKSMLPQIVVVMFIAFGMAIMFAFQGFVPFLEQIDNLVISVSRFQLPSPSAIITYCSVFVLTVMIGFSVAHADAV